jgi:hypothetical protein
MKTDQTTSSVQPPKVEVDLIISITQYARRFRVRRETVDDWVRMGLPHLKISPKCTRIVVPEADEWMKNRFGRRREIC